MTRLIPTLTIPGKFQIRLPFTDKEHSEATSEALNEAVIKEPGNSRIFQSLVYRPLVAEHAVEIVVSSDDEEHLKYIVSTAKLAQPAQTRAQQS